MKKTIAEDLPTRKHPPAVMSTEKDGDDKKKQKNPTDRIRQAVYDIRYRARREEITLSQAYSQYMQNSSMGQDQRVMVKTKLFGKGGMKAEDFNIQDFATDNVANALYEVFVKKTYSKEPITLTYAENLETSEYRKYKVKVTGKDGRSYVRYATRDKINSLRANPNIQSVEMTEYGEPYEGEKEKGEYTAKVKAGKDWDGDGEIESGAKEYRGVVHNAIQRKKGGTPDGKDTSNVKEDFIGERKKDEKDEDNNSEIIDVRKKNKKNTITMNPEIPGSERSGPGRLQMAHYDMGSVSISESQAKFAAIIQEKAESEKQQKLFGLALSVKRGETPRSEASSEVLKIVDSMSEKKIRDFAKTKHEGLPVRKEEMGCKDDERSIPTKKNLIKNKLRAMGMKNPLIMVSGYEPEGEVIDEKLRSREERMARTITPAQRKKQKEERERKEKLAHQATLALAGMTRTAKPGAVTKSTPKPKTPEANRRLPTGKKVDTLAVRASKVISSSYEPNGKIIDEGSEEAQERRFQKHGERSEGETHTRLIGTAQSNIDKLQARSKRTRKDHPEYERLQSRVDRLRGRQKDLIKSREEDKSDFRQGPVGSSRRKK